MMHPLVPADGDQSGESTTEPQEAESESDSTDYLSRNDIFEPSETSSPISGADDGVNFRRNTDSLVAPPRSRSLDWPDMSQDVKKSASLSAASPTSGIVPIAETCRSVSAYIENQDSHPPNLNRISNLPSPGDSCASLNNMLSSNGESFVNEKETLPIIVKQEEDDVSCCSSSVVSPSPSQSSAVVEIKVDKPQKILSTMDTYVTFRVLSKVRNLDGSVSEFEVERRYSDFVWLRQKLEHENEMLILPPLPEKHSLYSLDRFDPNFIRSRCFLLHLFMQALIRHSVVGNSQEILIFVTSELQVWVAHRKKQDISRLGALYNLAASARHITVSDSEFQCYMDACHDLGATLTALEKMASKWHLAECQSDEEICRTHVVLEHWSEIERLPRLKDAVCALEKAVDIEEMALSDLNSHFESKLALPIKHWALYAESVKQVLKRRDGLNFDQVSAKEAVKRKETEKEAALEQHSGKEAKLKQQLEELEEKSRKCDKSLRDSNCELRKELDCWKGKKESDLVGILRDMALERAEYHRKVLEGWEKALAEMAEDSSGLFVRENGTVKHD